MADRFATTNEVSISKLSPELPAQDTSFISAVVALIWPYSSSTQILTVRLADQDIRRRIKQGEIRVSFRGSSARSVFEAGIGSGDEVLLCLLGAEWVQGDASSTRSRSSVDWELCFKERLAIQIRNDQTQKLSVVDIDHPPLPSPEHIKYPETSDTASIALQLKPPTPSAPLPKETEREEWSSPAFMKRARLSYGSLIDSDSHLFDDDFQMGQPRKRTKFGRHSGEWRYSSRSPSLDLNETDGLPTVKIDAEPGRITNEGIDPPQGPMMLDEGCQTSDFELGAAESLASLSQQPAAPTGTVERLTADATAEPADDSPIMAEQVDEIQQSQTFAAMLPPPKPSLIVDFPTHDATSIEHGPETDIIPPLSPRLHPISSEGLRLVSPLISPGSGGLFGRPEISWEHNLELQFHEPPRIEDQRDHETRHSDPAGSENYDNGAEVFNNWSNTIDGRNDMELMQEWSLLQDSDDRAIHYPDLEAADEKPQLAEPEPQRRDPEFLSSNHQNLPPLQSSEANIVPYSAALPHTPLPMGKGLQHQEEVFPALLSARQPTSHPSSIGLSRSHSAQSAVIDLTEESDDGELLEDQTTPHDAVDAEDEEIYEFENFEEYDHEEQLDPDQSKYLNQYDTEKSETGSEEITPRKGNLAFPYNDEDAESVESASNAQIEAPTYQLDIQKGALDGSFSGVAEDTEASNSENESDDNSENDSNDEDDLQNQSEEWNSHQYESDEDDDQEHEGHTPLRSFGNMPPTRLHVRQTSVAEVVDLISSDDEDDVDVVASEDTDSEKELSDAEDGGISHEASPEIKRTPAPDLRPAEGNMNETENLQSPRRRIRSPIVSSDYRFRGEVEAEDSHQATDGLKTGTPLREASGIEGEVVNDGRNNLSTDASKVQPNPDRSVLQVETSKPGIQVKSPPHEQVLIDRINDDIAVEESRLGQLKTMSTEAISSPSEETEWHDAPLAPYREPTQHPFGGQQTNQSEGNYYSQLKPDGQQDSRNRPSEDETLVERRPLSKKLTGQLPTPDATQIAVEVSTRIHDDTFWRRETRSSAAIPLERDEINLVKTVSHDWQKSSRDRDDDEHGSTSLVMTSVTPKTRLRTNSIVSQSLVFERSGSLPLIDQPLSGEEGYDASAELAMDAIESPKVLNQVSPKRYQTNSIRALRTDLAEFTPLVDYLNYKDRKLDVIGVAVDSTNPDDAQRSKGGPRDYHVGFSITDPSLESRSINVVIFRPYRDALPDIRPGDGILLHNFSAQSSPDSGFVLRSEDISSWVVFRMNVSEKMSGPPVEFGEMERSYVIKLMQWYGDQDPMMEADFEEKSLPQGMTVGKVSG